MDKSEFFSGTWNTEHLKLPNDKAKIALWRKYFSLAEHKPIKPIIDIDVHRADEVEDELHGPLWMDKEDLERFNSPGICSKTPSEQIQEIEDARILEILDRIATKASSNNTSGAKCDHPEISRYVAGYNKQGCYKCNQEWEI